MGFVLCISNGVDTLQFFVPKVEMPSEWAQPSTFLFQQKLVQSQSCGVLETVRRTVRLDALKQEKMSDGDANGDLSGKRRRSGRGINERSRGKDRESVHSGSSTRHLLRLLVEEEYQSSHLRKLLTTALDKIEAETARAVEGERRAQEATQRLNELKLTADDAAARANRQISMFNLQLDNANREIVAVKERLCLVEGQRDEAEAEAANARTTARRSNERYLVKLAREEGRRLGFEAGFVKGQRLGFTDARAVGFVDTPEVMPETLHRPRLQPNEDFGSNRSASPMALPIRSLPMESPIPVHPPTILQTNFARQSSLDAASHRPVIREEERPREETVRLREEIGSPESLTSRSHLHDTVAGPSRPISTRTPPIQVYELDIPPQHELEQQHPPPPIHASAPPGMDPIFQDSSEMEQPAPSIADRFAFLARRVKHRQHPSDDTHSIPPVDDSSGPNTTRHSRDDPGPPILVPSEHPLESGNHKSNPKESTSGMLTRRVSNMVRKIAGAMERHSSDPVSFFLPSSVCVPYPLPQGRGSFLSRSYSRRSVSSRSSRRSKRGEAYRSEPSSPGTPPEITIEPPVRAPHHSHCQIHLHLIFSHDPRPILPAALTLCPHIY